MHNPSFFFLLFYPSVRRVRGLFFRGDGGSWSAVSILLIKHLSFEIEYFVASRLCKLCVTLRPYDGVYDLVQDDRSVTRSPWVMFIVLLIGSTERFHIDGQPMTILRTETM